MSRLDRHLAVLLGLAALTGVAVALPAPPAEPSRPARLPEAPPAVEGWTGGVGAPAEILPGDDRALEAVAWTYRNGDRGVWVTVARYAAENDSRRRPAAHLVVQERGAAAISRRVASLPLAGRGGPPVTVTVLTARYPEREVAVLYWYQLGGRVVTSEYALRVRLMANTILRRREDLYLVRVAASGAESPGEFLPVIYPHLARLLTL